MGREDFSAKRENRAESRGAEFGKEKIGWIRIVDKDYSG